MNKLGEIVFYDGHSEEIVAVLNNWPTFIEVATQSGLYAYSTCRKRQDLAYTFVDGHRFSTVEPVFDNDGYFKYYEHKPMTNKIAMFRLYGREITI